MARVWIKLLGIVLVALVMIPIGAVIHLVNRLSWRQRYCMIFCRMLAFVLSVRVTKHGELSADRPLLVVSNHISYIDIIALGSVLPIVFAPKADIAGWPVIGMLCKLAGCVFIDRRRSQTKHNLDNLESALLEGKPVLLFAEGTTGSGRRLLPIRSSYFQLVEAMEQPIHIQPVVLRYDRLNNLPLDYASAHRIAWVGDEELAPHAKILLQMGAIHASIHMLDDMDTAGSNRKALAKACETQMKEVFANSE